MPTMQGPTVTTAEQLLTLREPGCRHELVRGELQRMSPAGHWHGAMGSPLQAFLSLHVRKRKLGRVYLAETGFLLTRNPDTVLAPDIAFVRRARLPADFSPGYFPGHPDLAVEVTSPGENPAEVHGKALRWLDHGTQLVWIVDPLEFRVTTYRSRDDIRVLGMDDVLTGGKVVPGFQIAVRELFSD